MNREVFNNRLRQIVLLLIIIFFGCMLISEMSIFIPGVLGAITLYILSRNLYFQLIYHRKWKKGLTALLFIIGFLVIFAIPFYFAITLVSPKVSELVNNKEQVISNVKTIANKMQMATGITLLSEKSTENLSEKVSSFLPRILNSTTLVISNLAIMFFLMYFLLVGGREVEKALGKIIPLKPKNIALLASETKMMIKANALGIPVICIVQGIFAALGYWLFGVEDWGMWAFLTGVFAFFPVVGTMIIWVPVCLILYSSGSSTAALGLVAYSIIIIGNVDYIARLSLLKRMGDVHPVITIMGVIIGLGLFGFVGLVFGPLLISYFLILVKIYINEFSEEYTTEELETNTNQENHHNKEIT